MPGNDGYSGLLNFHVIEVPRSDKSNDECEDIFGCMGTRFAVSDGATEYIFSRLWARILVSSFLMGQNPFNEDIWKSNVRKWHTWSKLKDPSEPWFGDEKLKKGSAATFLGVSFISKMKWRAIALGDSCLLHSRKGSLLSCWPISVDHDFGNTPPLISTERVPSDPIIIKGSCEPGDVMILGTDALAKWILQSYQRGQDPLKLLLNDEGGSKRIVDIIESLRDSSSNPCLDDDDTLAIIIHI
jgi:hypothetical protein